MDEAVLIKDAQKGDITSYNSLVLHYQERIYNIAYRIMGETDSASDATQEAFIAAFRSIHTFPITVRVSRARFLLAWTQ